MYESACMCVRFFERCYCRKINICTWNIHQHIFNWLILCKSYNFSLAISLPNILFKSVSSRHSFHLCNKFAVAEFRSATSSPCKRPLNLLNYVRRPLAIHHAVSLQSNRGKTCTTLLPVNFLARISFNRFLQTHKFRAGVQAHECRSCPSLCLRFYCFEEILPKIKDVHVHIYTHTYIHIYYLLFVMFMCKAAGSGQYFLNSFFFFFF